MNHLVMYKVVEGMKPDRPLSGFSDVLWNLLLKAWDPEYGPQPPKRPAVQTILNQVKGDADIWDQFIIPPQGLHVEGEESCTYFGTRQHGEIHSATSHNDRALGEPRIHGIRG